MALWVTYDNLSAVVGSEAAINLARARGGLDVWVPETLEKTHDLVKIMGTHAAKKLCNAYGGSEITVSSRRKKESRQREVRDLIEKGHSATHIAMTLGITIRYVRYLAAQVRRQANYSSSS